MNRRRLLPLILLLSPALSFAQDAKSKPAATPKAQESFIETPAPVEKPAQDKEFSKKEPLEKPDNAEHLFGAHAALSVPHPLTLGLDYVHSSRFFSMGAATGQFGLTVSDVKVNIKNTELALRYHPWAGSFYIGAIYGNQNVTAEKTEVIQGQSITGKADVKSNYITPNVGWLWGAQNSGFFMSMELGFQSPSNVKTEFSSNADVFIQAQPEYKELEKDVIKQGDDLGNMGLPHLVLMKIGWLF